MTIHRFLILYSGIASMVACGSSGPSTDHLSADVPDAVLGELTLDQGMMDAVPVDVAAEMSPEDTTGSKDDGSAHSDQGGDEKSLTSCAPETCPEGTECVVGPQGESLCRTMGTIIEEFDDDAKKDPATTAAWGSGVLGVNLEGFGGNGQDGEFIAGPNMVVDTMLNGGFFQHTDYTIPAGVTVTVLGPNPYVVRATGDVIIDGWLRADGQPGQHACGVPSGPAKPEGAIALTGGHGGPGGGKGGDSGAGYGKPGSAGDGPGAGSGSGPGAFPNAAGAGGGSHASAGDDGVGKGSSYAGTSGPAYGEPFLVNLEGGSGGGGGGGRDNGVDTAIGDGIFNATDRPGGSGGGGGGAVGIFAVGAIHLTGMVTADGGQGGWGDWSGGGGGGSGGAVRLSALGEVYFDGGWLSARGGRSALITNSNQSQDTISGKGGDGIVRVESAEGLQGYLLNPDPIPTFGTTDGLPEGGTGEDGKFAPDEDVILDTEAGPYQFQSFLLPEGVTLTAIGKNPLEIKCKGNIEINGNIALDGDDGGNGYSACCGNPYVTAGRGAGGIAGPGGYDGGEGGSASVGEAGSGPGGAPGGVVGSFSSAGGGGFAEAGQNGGTNNCASGIGPAGGEAYGDAELTILEGGSGGGGAGDALSAACTWCEDQACIATSSQLNSCPDPHPACSYCPNVMDACVGVFGCHPTGKWNPGSGGGGGGGALSLETPGMVMLNGTVHMIGGDGGDNWGASTFNDGTCGENCEDGCAQGICNPSGGGSFGGSGGGGSGGALFVRATSVRATGWVKAVGGKTGILSQGGGCPVDPDAHNPLPGQGRGGRGSDGRIRIETSVPLGAIAVGDGYFTTSNVIPSGGTFAQSVWYEFPEADTAVTGITADGLGGWDVLELQSAGSGPSGDVDEGSAGLWAESPGKLDKGAFVRFRVDFQPPQPPQLGSIIDSVVIDWEKVTAP